MSYSLYFASSFKRSLKLLEKRYPHVRNDMKAALRVLERSPQLGDVILGSSGIRKLRVPNSDAAWQERRLLLVVCDSRRS